MIDQKLILPELELEVYIKVTGPTGVRNYTTRYSSKAIKGKPFVELGEHVSRSVQVMLEQAIEETLKDKNKA